MRAGSLAATDNELLAPELAAGTRLREAPAMLYRGGRRQSDVAALSVAYSVAGKVNSADKLYLVLESVRLDTKHPLASTAPVPADGAGGSGIG